MSFGVYHLCFADHSPQASRTFTLREPQGDRYCITHTKTGRTFLDNRWERKIALFNDTNPLSILIKYGTLHRGGWVLFYGGLAIFNLWDRLCDSSLQTPDSLPSPKRRPSARLLEAGFVQAGELQTILSV